MSESEKDANQDDENVLNEVEQEIFDKLAALDERSAKKVLSRLGSEASYLGCIRWLCQMKIHGHGPTDLL